MKFYVTRHGQTAWNRENLVCGITDLPLDETGREQARQTAHRKLLLRIGGVGIFSILVIALAVVLIRKLHKAGKC